MSQIQKTSDSTYIYLSLVDNTLDDIDKTWYSGKEPAIAPPAHELGALDRLPLEVLCLVLVQLDLQSLTDFRRVNRRSRRVVNCIPQYQRIRSHVPTLIRASLNINTAQYFTCLDLFEALSTASCDSCGDFGGYLYLINCRRVCYLCFTEERDFLPVSRNDAMRKFGLSSKHFTTIPHVKCFPGRYSSRGVNYRRKTTLFDYSIARQTGITTYGTLESMDEHTSAICNKKLEAFYERLSQVPENRGPVRAPRLEDSWDGKSSNPRRFLAVVRVPFFSGQTITPDWGVHCLACKSHHYHRPLHWRRMYTKETFQAHIMECGEIKDGKHSLLI